MWKDSSWCCLRKHSALQHLWDSDNKVVKYLYFSSSESFCTFQLFSFHATVDLVSDLACMNMENEDYSNFQWLTQTPMAFTTSIHPGFHYVQTYRVERAGMSENLQKLS